MDWAGLTAPQRIYKKKKKKKKKKNSYKGPNDLTLISRSLIKSRLFVGHLQLYGLPEVIVERSPASQP
jgi:hypothetical protein